MTSWGRKMFVTPGVVVDGKLVTNDLVEINPGACGSCSGTRSTTTGAAGAGSENLRRGATRLGNRVDARHPWNQHTLPKPAKRDFEKAYSWTMSAALVRRRGSPRPGHRRRPRSPGCGRRPLSGLVDIGGYVKATGQQACSSTCRRTALKPAVSYEWKIPQWEQRARTQSGPHLLPGVRRRGPRCTSWRWAWPRCEPVAPRTWTPFTVPDEAIAVGFTEAVRGVLSHHMVIRDGKIANYHPYPPTPWNGRRARCLRHGRGPYEDAVQNTPIFEENPPDTFKGIDIMRAVRSFDPCLPCGVHMYTGNGSSVRPDPLAGHRRQRPY